MSIVVNAIDLVLSPLLHGIPGPSRGPRRLEYTYLTLVRGELVAVRERTDAETPFWRVGINR